MEGKLSCAFCVGGLVTWEDVETNVEGIVGGGGMAMGRKAWLVVLVVRDVGGLDDRAPSDMPMRGDAGRLCVDGVDAAIGGGKVVCIIEGLGDEL
jgi:hypothetical protein